MNPVRCVHFAGQFMCSYFFLCFFISALLFLNIYLSCYDICILRSRFSYFLCFNLQTCLGVCFKACSTSIFYCIGWCDKLWLISKVIPKFFLIFHTGNFSIRLGKFYLQLIYSKMIEMEFYSFRTIKIA